MTYAEEGSYPINVTINDKDGAQTTATASAGLYGSAPIVYETNAAMTAENDSYTGMDFTADGSG